MKLVTKDQFEKLREAGLLKTTKGNKNFYIASQKKPSRRHKFYIVESKRMFNFLGIPFDEPDWTD